MKILFVHDAKTVKDTENHIYTDTSYNMKVWNRYLKHCDEFTVILRQQSKEISTEIAKSRYNYMDTSRIRYVPIPDLMNPKTNYFSYFIRKKHRNIIKQEVKKADFIIVRLPSASGHIALNYAKRTNKKYLIEVVGDPFISLWYYGNIYGKVLAPISSLKMKRDIKHSTNIIYVSQRFLQNLYPTKNRSIGIPDVFLDPPNISVLNKRIQRINSMNKDVIKLGLIGSLDVVYRGHETLLKAATLLKSKQINVEIHFLGPGNIPMMMNKAKKYNVENETKCDGTLPSGEAVYNWIDNIDILVMPTKAETLGRAIIEAMSRGCPVIGSLETAIGEQIGSDCLIKSDDYIGIADIILKMINNKKYMLSCAYENYYRSFKYTTEQTDLIRDNFIKLCLNEGEDKYNVIL